MQYGSLSVGGRLTDERAGDMDLSDDIIIFVLASWPKVPTYTVIMAYILKVDVSG